MKYIAGHPFHPQEERYFFWAMEDYCSQNPEDYKAAQDLLIFKFLRTTPLRGNLLARLKVRDAQNGLKQGMILPYTPINKRSSKTLKQILEFKRQQGEILTPITPLFAHKRHHQALAPQYYPQAIKYWCAKFGL